MKARYFQIIWLLIFISVVSCASTKLADSPKGVNVVARAETPPADSSEPYVLGTGDELSINVWRNDDLNRTVKIDPSGNIYLPLAGEIPASGMTIPELRKDIALRLSKYLVNPQVDVNATAVSSRKIYVLGEVRSPGTFNLEHDMPALEAISRAGGFTEDADRDHLLLIRGENGAARVSVLAMDLRKVKDGGPRPASGLRKGDIIFVPATRIADFERFMVRLQNIINPFVTLERGIILEPQARAVLKGEGFRNNVIISH